MAHQSLLDELKTRLKFGEVNTSFSKDTLDVEISKNSDKSKVESNNISLNSEFCFVRHKNEIKVEKTPELHILTSLTKNRPNPPNRRPPITPGIQKSKKTVTFRLPTSNELKTDCEEDYLTESSNNSDMISNSSNTSEDQSETSSYSNNDTDQDFNEAENEIDSIEKTEISDKVKLMKDNLNENKILLCYTQQSQILEKAGVSSSQSQLPVTIPDAPNHVPPEPQSEKFKESMKSSINDLSHPNLPLKMPPKPPNIYKRLRITTASLNVSRNEDIKSKIKEKSTIVNSGFKLNQNEDIEFSADLNPLSLKLSQSRISKQNKIVRTLLSSPKFQQDLTPITPPPDILSTISISTPTPIIPTSRPPPPPKRQHEAISPAFNPETATPIELQKQCKLLHLKIKSFTLARATLDENSVKLYPGDLLEDVETYRKLKSLMKDLKQTWDLVALL
ncbi:hypothetical protein HK096_008451 [Nowakowskiella sp. JEL0078]|nr:hypothetical protein HK096_008451 [Nowakowskiella sp. JEL0078]